MADGFAINDAGQVAGHGNNRALFWNGAATQNLGTLGGSYSFARGLNNLGQVVGYSADASGNELAFFWNGTTMVSMGTLGANVSVANGINDAGYAVGVSVESTPGNQRAFGWNGTMTDLGGAAQDSWAQAVNSSGQVAGTYAGRAAVWTGGVRQNLAMPWFASQAYGINASGWVVGQADAGGYRAFVWDGNAGYDLNTLLANGAGWTALSAALGIPPWKSTTPGRSSAPDCLTAKPEASS